MPKVQPGAATQAAARKVADSDKSKAGRDPLPAGAMDPTDQDNSPMPQADEAQQQAVESLAREAQADAKTTARQRLSKTTTKKPAPVEPKRLPASGGLTFTSLDEGEDQTVIVYYGPAGTRKTTSALRATQTGPGRVLVIAAEAGLKKIALQRNGVDTSRVVFWPPRGESVSYEGLESLFYQVLADLERDPNSWLAVSWDSLTEVIQTMIDQATQADIARLQEIAKASKTKLEIRKSYEREGGDYGVVTQQFRQLLRKWRSLPCHQIFIALEENRQETVELDDGKKQKVGVIGPSLPPKVREDVEQHADIILRTTVIDVNGIGSTGFGRATPAEDLRAKDRYGVLPTLMVDPGFERVWGYITGELKAEVDEAQAVTDSAGPVLESKAEEAERKKAEAAARRAARQAAPKDQAPRPSEKVTADSGTPDNPPM